MCGIIGLTCKLERFRRKPSRVVVEGLEKLEYRGYDSVGLASIFNGKIIVKKGKGKLVDVKRSKMLEDTPGTTIIGHTRWATHGKPSDENAHPHVDCKGAIAVVHNGTIHNFLDLKEELQRLGHKFVSDTDTEVIPHLIEEYYRYTGDFYKAFKEAIKRKDSPLVIGVSEYAKFAASDIPAFLQYTRDIIVLRDYEVGYITWKDVVIEDLISGEIIDWRSRVRRVGWTAEAAAKGGYPHFMLKEIHEQPLALKETFMSVFEEIDEAVKLVMDSNRIFFTAAGTSYHASLVASYMFRNYAATLTVPFIASEYKCYTNVVKEGDLLIAVSQSGETIDTLMAVREFKKRGARVLAVSNVIESAIPRESDYTIYTRAGPEIGVAATKTFTTQVLALSLLILKYALNMGQLESSEYKEYVETLKTSPKIVSKVLSALQGYSKSIGELLAEKNNVYYLGRGLGVPIAMEGALKLKEIAYIHAEAYPAGENKHGPIALVEKGFPTIFIVLNDETKDLIINNVMEMKARDAITIGLVPENTHDVAKILDIHMTIPCHHPILAPIVYMPPLQLIAYYAAVKRGYDPDKPRNLAKTVTVE